MSGTQTQYLLDQAVLYTAQIHDTVLINETPLTDVITNGPYDMMVVTTTLKHNLNELLLIAPVMPSSVATGGPTVQDMLNTALIQADQIQGATVRNEPHDVQQVSQDLSVNIDTIYRLILFPPASSTTIVTPEAAAAMATDPTPEINPETLANPGMVRDPAPQPDPLASEAPPAEAAPKVAEEEPAK